MAKIESIVLKTSDYSQKDLFDAITGLSSNGNRPERLEQGEIVLRYTGTGNLVDIETGEEILDGNGDPIPDTPKGVELWTLNADGDPTQVRLDLSAEIPDYDLSANIGDISLNELKDVAISEVVASQVLTWDGLQWVNRDLPEFGGEGSIIPTLNEVGDVNYGGQAVNNKFGPEPGDVLLYSYDGTQLKNVWIPYKLDVDLIDGLALRDKEYIIDRSRAETITIGNPVIKSAGEARFGLNAYPSNKSGAEIAFSFGHVTPKGDSTVEQAGMSIGDYGETTFDIDGDVILRPRGLGRPGKSLIGIKYNEITDVPVTLPDDTYLATLLHVRNEMARQDIGILRNVNDFGILQGQVLGWDSISQEYRPLSGIAPDLTIASLEDLSDVSGRDKGRGRPLTWQPASSSYIPERVHQHDVIPGYYDGISTVNDANTNLPAEAFPVPQENLFDSEAPACDVYNLGRISIVDNMPYVCLRCRSEQFDSGNDIYGYVKMLVDGYNTVRPGGFSPVEYQPSVIGETTRKDPLSAAAYEGTLGSLYNVSTADVFPGASPVYRADTNKFEMGYPAIYLPDYSIGELSDVDVTGAGVGYGLLWNGEQWVASSLDQKIRLDDLQDVQFGSLGVVNTKLVAAYMLSPSSRLGPTFTGPRDVSTILAVSTQKADLTPGTTYQGEWQSDPTAPTQGGSSFGDWRQFPPFSVAELLDSYIRWVNDPSWQTIDGDGTIEFFFKPLTLLDNRQLLKKNIVFQGQGGYQLMLTQAGGLVFSVTGPAGSGGFSISTPVNVVSTNNWHHIALVKQGTENRLYYDGYLQGSATSSAPWTGDGLFVLGRNDLNDNNGLTLNLYKGTMSDLRVTKGRAKYEGDSYSIPSSIEAEAIDSTPQAGDFLSYDGTKWTNVNGVEGDISNKSVNELADVDTATNNPETGDALVWSGAKWEPGIPGIGATWALDDFTDVETYYQSAVPYILWSQAEATTFSQSFYANKEDNGRHRLLRSQQYGYGQQLDWYDCDYTCQSPPPPCGSKGPYSASSVSYIRVLEESKVEVMALRMLLKNKWNDCSLASFEYHDPMLYYEKCPDRSYDGTANPGGDIPGFVPEDYIPCWGVIEDHINEALAYGNLGALKDVSNISPTFGQALSWDGTQWAPSNEVAADISQNSINDLRDVNVSNAQSGQGLKFDGTEWTAAFIIASLLDLPDVKYYQFKFDDPIFHGPDPDTGAPALVKDSPSSTNFGDGIHSSANATMDIGSEGLRGISFSSTASTKSHVYNLTNSTTIITSVVSNDSRDPATWMEINPLWFRFAGQGSDWGSQGVLVGDNLYIRYENTTRVLGNYGEYDVVPKGLLLDYVDEGLKNLDLSRNILENLGNVNTTGKLEGWALVWDGSNWVASPSVAADISLSSIGDLADVTKVTGESVTFDVPKFKTSAPGQINGGLELTSSDGNAWIGWSDVVAGTPYLANITNTFSGNRATELSVEPQQIRVGGDGGILYINEPALTDLTAPCFRQVKQQIVRELTDYNALFFLDGNSFTERNYGWNVTVQITTNPSIALFSKFNGESSYQFRKVNQDKLFWAIEDGCPLQWSMETLWSFEMWVYISSSDSGDGSNELFMCPRTVNQEGGIQLGLWGGQRNIVFFKDGGFNITPTVLPEAINQEVTFDEWHHLALQQEGEGTMRFYVDGSLVGERQTNSAPRFEGGISFGGAQQSSGAQTATYFTGFIDDIRIAKGWLPYTPGLGLIPTPVEPLPPGAFTATFGTLNSLSDVNTSNPAPVNGNVLMWDNVAKQWKPGPFDQLSYDISSNVLTDLSDVNTENQISGEDDILRWNAVTSNWERSKIDGNGGVKSIHARTASPGQVPNSGNLFAGEIFINMADKKAYTLDATGLPFVFATEESVEGILATVDRVVGGSF